MNDILIYIITAVVLLVFFVFLVLILLRQYRFEAMFENLQRNLNELEAMQTNFQKENSSFLYEKLGSMDEKINIQIEKNQELIDKVKEQVKISLETQQKKSEESFEKLTQTIEKRLTNINEKVEERLKTGFDDIGKTFKDIIKGIARISEAQQNIEKLSTQVFSLQSILTDKKTRGIFGEVQLKYILEAIFGDKKELYQTQYKLTNATIVDAIIKAPEPLGLLAVDSKFPLENYNRLVEKEDSPAKFRQDMKKHIDDISSKYIVLGETAEVAVLFLPAEAIFAEIHANHQEITDYAASKKVWIASPTTLMALFTTIMAFIRDIKTQAQAKTIQAELLKLSENFNRYQQRWESLTKDIDKVQKDVHNLNATNKKITDEFRKIENVEFDKGEEAKIPNF